MRPTWLAVIIACDDGERGRRKKLAFFSVPVLCASPAPGRVAIGALRSVLCMTHRTRFFSGVAAHDLFLAVGVTGGRALVQMIVPSESPSPSTLASSSALRSASPSASSDSASSSALDTVPEPPPEAPLDRPRQMGRHDITIETWNRYKVFAPRLRRWASHTDNVFTFKQGAVCDSKFVSYPNLLDAAAEPKQDMLRAILLWAAEQGDVKGLKDGLEKLKSYLMACMQLERSARQLPMLDAGVCSKWMDVRVADRQLASDRGHALIKQGASCAQRADHLPTQTHIATMMHLCYAGDGDIHRNPLAAMQTGAEVRLGARAAPRRASSGVSRAFLVCVYAVAHYARDWVSRPACALSHVRSSPSQGLQ